MDAIYETDPSEHGVTVHCYLADGRSGSYEASPGDDAEWADPYTVEAVLEACELANENAHECDHCEGAGSVPINGGSDSIPCPHCRPAAFTERDYDPDDERACAIEHADHLNSDR